MLEFRSKENIWTQYIFMALFAAPPIYGISKGAFGLVAFVFLSVFSLFGALFIKMLINASHVAFVFGESELIVTRGKDKEMKKFPISEIKSTTYSKVRRMSTITIWTFKPYDENVYIVNGVENLDGLKGELRIRLGNKFIETDNWFTKITNVIP
jgi:hypothetical protein